MTRVTELVASRELGTNLVLRELRSRYKRSFIGWGWSLLNPILTVGIYWVVFGSFLDITPPVGDPSGLSSFVLFLVCGLLPWAFLQGAIESSPEVLVQNGNLIKKVYFPREMLVISSVGALLVTFLIELGVLCVLLLIAGNMVLAWIPMLLVLIVLETVLILGIGLALSALNVYFRDVKHFTKIALQALFYSAPIVYPIRFVPERSEILGIDLPVRRLYELNPLVRMIGTYRDVLYDLRFPVVEDLLYFAAWAVALIVLGWLVFARLEPRLAEEV